MERWVQCFRREVACIDHAGYPIEVFGNGKVVYGVEVGNRKGLRALTLLSL